MPLYAYNCPNNHQTEEIRNVSQRHNKTTCHYCGEEASYKISPPNFKLDWVPTICDSPKDIWGNIKGMDGADGKNPLTYKSDKPFLDMANNRTRKNKRKRLTLADL